MPWKGSFNSQISSPRRQAPKASMVHAGDQKTTEQVGYSTAGFCADQDSGVAPGRSIARAESEAERRRVKRIDQKNAESLSCARNPRYL